MKPSDVIRKLRKAAAEPSLLRYRVLGALSIFPVRKVDTPFFADLPIYCISLASATQRRELMSRQASAAGWEGFRFVEAVEASELELDSLVASGDYDPAGAREHHGVDLTPAQIACSLSHARVYEMIVKSGDKRALILEDDALLESRRLRQLEDAALPSDWDVIFLSSFLSETPPRGHVDGRVYGDESWTGSSAAYLVTADAARRLAAASRPVQHAADGLLGRNMNVPSGTDHPFKQKGARTTLRCYLIWPEPVVNGSDVHFYATTLRSRTP